MSKRGGRQCIVCVLDKERELIMSARMSHRLNRKGVLFLGGSNARHGFVPMGPRSLSATESAIGVLPPPDDVFFFLVEVGVGDDDACVLTVLGPGPQVNVAWCRSLMAVEEIGVDARGGWIMR